MGDPILRGIPEKRWQGMVERAARLNGWKVYHTFDSRRSVAGFPDLILIRDDRIIAAELKTERGKVSAEQRAWLDAFAATGKVETYVWRPSDWDDMTVALAR